MLNGFRLITDRASFHLTSKFSKKISIILILKKQNFKHPTSIQKVQKKYQSTTNNHETTTKNKTQHYHNDFNPCATLRPIFLETPNRKTRGKLCRIRGAGLLCPRPPGRAVATGLTPMGPRAPPGAAPSAPIAPSVTPPLALLMSFVKDCFRAAVLIVGCDWLVVY